MLNDLRNLVKSELDDTIFDVVIYGSAVKGKAHPRDTDIMIIFRKGTLKERLEKAQRIKRRVDAPGKLDVKAVLLEELFDPAFFARSGILLEGISIKDSKPIAQKLGFDGFALFVYSLQNKSHTDKVKFNYILSGRNGDKGIIAHLQGTHLAPGVILIPMKHSLEFEDVLNMHHVQFTRKNMLVEI